MGSNGKKIKLPPPPKVSLWQRKCSSIHFPSRDKKEAIRFKRWPSDFPRFHAFRPTFFWMLKPPLIFMWVDRIGENGKPLGKTILASPLGTSVADAMSSSHSDWGDYLKWTPGCHQLQRHHLCCRTLASTDLSNFFWVMANHCVFQASVTN